MMTHEEWLPITKEYEDSSMSISGSCKSRNINTNSQDNSPMESFFSRMKSHILDLVALCPNAETAVRLISGYLDSYNTEQYQYNLAGLTPLEFYQYVTTGIYPLDNYYGVKASELRTVTELVNDRRKEADEKNRKERERRVQKNIERNQLPCTAKQKLAKDQKILHKMKAECIKDKNMAEQQIREIDEILEKTKRAGKFLAEVSDEILQELQIPENWQKYKELNYIYDMNGMF